MFNKTKDVLSAINIKKFYAKNQPSTSEIKVNLYHIPLVKQEKKVVVSEKPQKEVDHEIIIDTSSVKETVSIAEAFAKR